MRVPKTASAKLESDGNSVAKAKVILTTTNQKIRKLNCFEQRSFKSLTIEEHEK